MQEGTMNQEKWVVSKRWKSQGKGFFSRAFSTVKLHVLSHKDLWKSKDCSPVSEGMGGQVHELSQIKMEDLLDGGGEEVKGREPLQPRAMW